MLSRCAPLPFRSLSLLFAIFAKAFGIFACGEYVWVLARMWCLHYCMPPDAVVKGVLHSSVAMRTIGTVVTSKSESGFSIASIENITLITKY
jgi:hypothetical protein